MRFSHETCIDFEHMHEFCRRNPSHLSVNCFLHEVKHMDRLTPFMHMIKAVQAPRYTSPESSKDIWTQNVPNSCTSYPPHAHRTHTPCASHVNIGSGCMKCAREAWRILGENLSQILQRMAPFWLPWNSINSKITTGDERKFMFWFPRLVWAFSFLQNRLSVLHLLTIQCVLHVQVRETFRIILQFQLAIWGIKLDFQMHNIHSWLLFIPDQDQELNNVNAVLQNTGQNEIFGHLDYCHTRHKEDVLLRQRLVVGRMQ